MQENIQVTLDTFLSLPSLFNWFFKSPTAVIGFIAAILAFYNIHIQRRSHLIQRSLDFDLNFKNNESIKKLLNQAIDILVEAKNKKGNEYYKYLVEISNNRKNPNFLEFKILSNFLNEWEHCANGIYTKSYDSNILYCSYGSVVISTLEYSLPFILASQNIYGVKCCNDIKDRNHKKDEPNPSRRYLYIRFILLATEWSIRRYKEENCKPPKELINAQKLLKRFNHIVYGKGFYHYISMALENIKHNSSINILIEVQKNLIKYMVDKNNINRKDIYPFNLKMQVSTTENYP